MKLNAQKVKRLFGSLDWGFTNPGVLQVWALDHDDRMYLIREIYQTKGALEWWLVQAREMRQRFNVTTFVCDPSEPAYIEAFRHEGFTMIPGFNDVAPGIQAVAQRLRPAGDGRARLFVLADALVARDPLLVEAKRPTCLQEEMDSYQWARGADGKPNKEEPIKEHDHSADAMRYAVAYIDNVGSKEARFFF